MFQFGPPANLYLDFFQQKSWFFLLMKIIFYVLNHGGFLPFQKDNNSLLNWKNSSNQLLKIKQFLPRLRNLSILFILLVKRFWMRPKKILFLRLIKPSYYINRLMEKDKRLLAKKKLKPSEVLITSMATRDPLGEFEVQITEVGLEEKAGSGCSTISFDFDVKYSFSLNPPYVRFQGNEETATYKLKSSEEVEQWRVALKDKLNQRGFHEQFKPFHKIGKGNFASVYLVQKLEDKKNYAVKAFSKEAAYSEEKGKQCLMKEIQVMRNLSHKNCMKLYEVFESENSLYIVFELLEGGQLYDKVKSKYKFKHHEVTKIIRGILLGLREMHEKKIMHRDLKPENLLFRKKHGDWDCVIADFGLAEFSQEVSEYLFVRCGTPGYVAPEVINIKDMSTKYKPICDIFSLGLIFYLLVMGKSAFPGRTYNEVLNQNRAANVNLSGDQFKHLSSETLDLLEKMLKKNPEHRISAEEALKHPFFENENTSEEEEVEEKEEKMKPSFSAECDSPLLTSANPRRRLNMSLKKDSCVDFKMPKENVMTGKTETVKGENKISGFNHDMTAAKKPKVSHFSMSKNH